MCFTAELDPGTTSSHGAVPSFPVHAMQLILAVTQGLVTRRNLQRALVLFRQAERRRLQDYMRWVRTIDSPRYQRAKMTLGRFLTRWKSWAHARSSHRHHMAWLDSNSRLLHEMRAPAPNNVAEKPTRHLVSWSRFSGEVSTFAPMSPMQQWLAGVHKATSRLARIIQVFWCATKLRRAARRLRLLLVNDRAMLCAMEKQGRLAWQLIASRELLDVSRRYVTETESLSRAGLARFFTSQQQMISERQAVVAAEERCRRSELEPLWADTQSTLFTVAAYFLEQEEVRHRCLLATRSVMKLLALHKESWLEVGQMERCNLYTLYEATEKSRMDGDMLLTERDLVEVSYTPKRWSAGGCRGGNRVVQVASTLADVTSLEVLSRLVDNWYIMLLRHEATEWGRLNESFARKLLRLRLENLPLENNLVDRERQNRAALVQRMLCGLHLRPCPPQKVSESKSAPAASCRYTGRDGFRLGMGSKPQKGK